MFTIHTLPTSIRIERDKLEFSHLAETFDYMKSVASGPDRSTTAIVPASAFSQLVDSDQDVDTHFAVVTLPESAEPYVEQLVAQGPSYMTHGWHLGHERLCLAFTLYGAGVELYVDAHNYVGAVSDVERGRAHLVLALVCGQILHFRLLDGDLRIEDSEHEDSNLHYCVFTADNYKPRRQYSEEQLQASLDAANARLKLPYDPSLLKFKPFPLSLNFK